MRNIEIVELLLDKGAKVSALDKVLFEYTHYTHHNRISMMLFSSVMWMFLFLRKEIRPST